MALYHTYRPQQFADIVGQVHIVQTLTNQIKNNKTAHAYLFSGPRGSGKTTTARLIAKAVNCLQRKENQFEPCNECDACKEITLGRAIDIIEIDAASNTGVDNVRENIIESIHFRPNKAKYKVFIIDEVHMLSTSAFNALLKTLEEPPSHVLFILATTELHKVPETIVSRCQHFIFHKLSFSELMGYLENIAKQEKIKVDTSVFERIIHKCDGCARDAIKLLDQLLATGEKKITEEVANIILPTSNISDVISFLSSVFEKNMQQVMTQIQNIADANTQINFFIDECINVLRVVMILSLSPDETTQKTILANYDEKSIKTIENLAKNNTSKSILHFIDILLQRKKQIKSTPLPQMVLEMSALEWILPEEMVIKEITPKIIPPIIPEKKENKPLPQQEIPIIETKKEEGKDICKEDIEKIWNKIVENIEKIAQSLSIILKSTQVLETKGNTVILGVQFALHKDKLLETQTKNKIEQILTDILGTKTLLDVQTKQTENNTSHEEVQNLANLLGGQIIS
ncbi:MAG: DNA polymerase III subunit gamma/tau [Candidatus Magasanikbacteria bacterium]